jgi:hypothetical protein
MVAHCANPACSAPLHYLREGRLFQFEVRSISVDGGFRNSAQDTSPPKISRKVSHFWLCGECAPQLTLTFDQTHGVTVVPLARVSTQETIHQISA